MLCYKTWFRKGIWYCECIYSRYILCICGLSWGILISLIGFLLGNSSASFIRIIYCFFSLLFVLLLSWGDQSCMQHTRCRLIIYLYGSVVIFFFSSSMQVFSPSKANWSLWKDREGWEAATSQNSSWNPSFRICKLQSLVKSFHFCPQKTAQWGYLVTWTEQRNPLNALQHIVSWLGAESCSAKARKPGLLWKLRAPFSRLQTSGDAFSG